MELVLHGLVWRARAFRCLRTPQGLPRSELLLAPLESFNADRGSLVFVHGLQGHPEKTWTYKHEPEASKKKRHFWRRSTPEPPGPTVYWPYDLLRRQPELSRTRILTWGYDSHVTKFFSATNKQDVSHHGNDLMVDLEQIRKNVVSPNAIMDYSGMLIISAKNEATYICGS